MAGAGTVLARLAGRAAVEWAVSDLFVRTPPDRADTHHTEGLRGYVNGDYVPGQHLGNRSGAQRRALFGSSHDGVQVTIDASSVNTHDAQRDAHLRSADFLDVEKFPTIDFRSTGIKKTGDDTYEITGQFTLHGVTGDLTLTVEAPAEVGKDPWGKLRRGGTATGKLNRKDYGLNWNQTLETGGILVGDEVKLTIDVELVKAE